MADSDNPWATPSPDAVRAASASAPSYGRDTWPSAPRRWWSRPTRLLTAGHTTAGAAWLATVCLLIAYRLLTSMSLQDDRGAFAVLGFFIVGLPAAGVALVLIHVALGLLVGVVTPLALVWLAEGQPNRQAVIWSLGHAVVACVVPVGLLGYAVMHGL